MARQKLLELQKKLDLEIANAERIARLTKDAANELSHAAIASPSTSGDREHATNAARINQEKLNKLTTLKNEIELATNQKMPETIAPVCYFNNYYLVSNPMYLKGVSLISPESLFGQAVLGKKVGDTYEYQNPAGETIGGIIKNIE